MRIVEICMNPGKGHLSGEGYRWWRPGRGSRAGVVEQPDGRGRWAGTVAQAGVVLPRLLADRLGLTGELADVVARAGFFPLRHRGRALVDAMCALAAGATCLSDVEAMTAQEEIFGAGGGASDSTM